MANTKISQLPLYSGTAADLRWFVMNNSGETITFKYSGYSTSITYGTGTDSIKSVNAVGAAGTRAIAIGKGSSAAGDDSISIGDITGNNLGAGSINIGKHYQVAGNYAIAIGFGAFVSGSDSISIGRETAAYNGGIVLGGNTSRATSVGSIVIGNSNERNLGAGYSSIMGYGNKVGDAPNYNPGPYNNIIASFSVINGDNSAYGYNNIFGGSGNYITGNTENTFIGNGYNLTSIRTGDVIINNKGNTITGTGTYKTFLGGNGNTFSGAGNFSSIINGEGNTITDAGYAFIGGGKYNAISGGTNYSSIIGGYGNVNYGNYSGIFNGTLNTINNPATEYSTIVGAYSSQTEGDNSHIFGGLYNQIFNEQSVIVGGAGNIITAGSYNSEMFGCRDSIISGNSIDTTFINTISGNSNGYDRVVMLGTSGRTANADDTTFVENIRAYKNINTGTNNLITSTGADLAIIGGASNTLGANSVQSTITAAYNNNVQATILGFIAGTQDNTITSAGYTYAVIGGGYNTINATNASAGNAMYSSYFCVDNTINDNAILGNSSNWFSGSRNGTMGGYGKHNHISNSYSSTITNNGATDVGEWFNKIDSSSASTITTSKKSQIIGGEGNAITSRENVVMLACNNRTASRSNATMVENLVVFNYAGLNFVDDTAAAAGGVVLGQIYHTGGLMKIRIV